MANDQRAQHHHAKAGEALKAGDMKAAAKHFGHALASCRNNAKDGLPEPDADDAPVNSVAALRSRLAGFKK